MALATGQALNVVEKRELAKLEKQIDKHLPSFLLVGNALTEIRDRNLYRGTHKTMEAYMQQRFGIERAHGYRLMTAAEVVEDLSPIGDKTPRLESQLREVAKAPREQRQEVVETVLERCQGNGREPTAKDYKLVVDELAEPADTPVTEPADIAGGYEPDEYRQHVAKAVAEMERCLRHVESYGDHHQPDDYKVVVNTINDLWKALQRWKG